MRKRTLLIVVSLLTLLGLTFGPAALLSPAQASTGSDESAFVQKINALRASKGLGPLQVDGQLTSIARSWASKMAAAGDISHNPNLASEVTQNWTVLGENVGMGGDVESLHQAFVNSPPHYHNLVDARYTHIGVGVVYGKDGTIFTSHEFMALAGAATASTPAPTSPPQASVAASQPASTSPAATAPHAPTTPDSVPVAAPARAVQTKRVLHSLRMLDHNLTS